ncbi:zinc-ribbon domain-containing protein [Leisingera sp. SS27]|uniref:zinc-ribbon domain-containing protein n=1 Tax=Leisingera sp. SS27 TaxID=2979462 RepID=UPI0023300341|nr:zinc-ribbon domain-containing protein [Leisingera sp. SS27]MDC0658419.1 zinc-ribbon domain-containing protein [Leisingera sp. SS27]
MRLTCPNCAAQYEVPEDVIPPEGRDVQCSNCGQTWYQAAAGTAEAGAEDALENIGIEEAFARAAEAEAREKAERELAAKAEQDAAAKAERDAEAERERAAQAEQDAGQQPEASPEADLEDSTPEDTAQEAVPELTDETESAAAPQDRFEEDADDQSGGHGEGEEEDLHAEDPPQPQRGRTLDPEMSDILREEAAREAELRKAEAQSLEIQPDLGLEGAAPVDDEAARRSRQARDRMARMRGEDPRQLAAAEGGSRKELLPDIEEINSTLRSAGTAATAPQADPEDVPVRRKSGFARGFAVSLIAALILVMVYDKAPLIAEKLPQADPVISSYVDWVDQARLWLDNQVKSVTSTQ